MRKQRTNKDQVESIGGLTQEIRRHVESLRMKLGAGEGLLFLVNLTHKNLRIRKELNEVAGGSSEPARQIQYFRQFCLRRQQHCFADHLEC